jgi:oligopeptide/dipeptide ABC transporter ATP-binding protein
MLLSVENLSVRFKTEDGIVHAVNGVTFDLEAAETVAIVGESGCGKSVTGLSILRLLPKRHAEITSGRIVFEGTDLLDLPEPSMRELRGKDIAMVFQDPMTSLNPILLIGKQLAETLTAHKSVSWAQARETGAELLRTVGIPDPKRTMNSYPHQLSGGMRQRVMIAMALALEPKLLIADEPTTALDVTIQAQVLALIRALTRETGTSVMLITHDLGIVASMTQRVNVMYAGLIVETASTAEIFGRPRHPYTVGLLSSVPRLDSEAEELVPIEGVPPDQLQPPIGCPFAPRCAWRRTDCWTTNPPLGPANDRGARVACHNPVLPEEIAAARPTRPDFTPAAPPSQRASAGNGRTVETWA